MTAPAAIARPEPDTRRRIVETAERFFREIGYQKTTVADIARALRMSPANVYRFFESKKAINEAVAERLFAEIEAALDPILDGPGTPPERLAAMIEATHRMTVERYTDQHRLHEMVEVALTESWQVVHGHIGRMAARFERLVREGMEAGCFAPGDPYAAARCAQVALIRFFHPGMVVQCASEPGPTLEEMTRFVLAGLGCRD